jgi:hypothetical protein
LHKIGFQIRQIKRNRSPIRLGSNTLSWRPVNVAVEVAPVKAQLAIDSHTGNIDACLVTQRIFSHAEVFCGVVKIHQSLLQARHPLDLKRYGIGDCLDEKISGSGLLRVEHLD